MCCGFSKLLGGQAGTPQGKLPFEFGMVHIFWGSTLKSERGDRDK